MLHIVPSSQYPPSHVAGAVIIRPFLLSLYLSVPVISWRRLPSSARTPYPAPSCARSSWRRSYPFSSCPFRCPSPPFLRRVRMRSSSSRSAPRPHPSSPPYVLSLCASWAQPRSPLQQLTSWRQPCASSAQQMWSSSRCVAWVLPLPQLRGHLF
nr:MAG TPA: hypothetical protein [Caudoviricetes sp.]